ncbi:GGDEF domain-containing protein [Granulicella sp. dw_53]|uniref:GGDEF domain-containing protein n=1 Tax=Granulicella sp. dw_53 TaxID=2719792 RepID=UPI001BD50491|nr:GGDEF domain-containing protein [Granulicella sp. dw_53]
MSPVSFLDNKTLLACLLMTASLSALGFARTWKTHPALRGAGSFSLAFLSGIGTCLLFALGRHSSPVTLFFSTVVADTLICCVSAFILSGIERFIGVQRFSRLGWTLVAIASLLFFVFTELHPALVPRILVIDSVNVILRMLIAVELFRQSGRRNLRTLGSVMGIFSLISLAHCVGTVVHGPSSRFMQSNAVQTSELFLSLLYVMATGLLLFLLLNDELVIRLEDEAARDFMSGALNRRGIERTLLAEMERSRRHGPPLTLALIDLDYFKQLNDSRGHAAGDAAILSVSRAITSALRSYDHVGRFGGDEFLLILPDTSIDDATNVLQRTRELVAKSFGDGLTLSIGVTILAGEKEDLITLLSRADEALYAAKSDGRNCTRMRLPSNLPIRLADKSAIAVKLSRRFRFSRITFYRRPRKT